MIVGHRWERDPVNKELIKWDRLKAEIQLTEDVAILSKLNYSLEAVQKWAKQSKQSLETQNEIAEYRLRLNRKQGEWIEANIPENGYSNLPNQNDRQEYITLSDAGIDYHDSPKFRILARIPEDKFEDFITNTKNNSEELTSVAAYNLLKNTIATKWTGDQESYTPEIYIESARSVMGSIDLDPASSDKAQEIVKAKKYFTKLDNGLIQKWEGNIFLNPPYSHPEILQFIEKLLNDLRDGQQAILLTNNNTDTNFFHKASKRASAVCFTKGRINFYKEDNSKTYPTNGQVFYYFGNNRKSFIEHFSSFGMIMVAL